MLTFGICAGEVLGLDHETLKNCLMAIRAYHLRSGAGDPLRGMDWLWPSLRGLKGLEGQMARTFPVTAEMRRWLSRHLSPIRAHGSVGRNRPPQFGSDAIDTVAWAGLQTKHPFLLQTGFQSGAGFGPAKCLNGDDVSVTEGRVTIGVRGSKL